MTPRTRLDRVVEVRERAQDEALAGFACARSATARAHDLLTAAVAAAREDGRAAGPVELFQVDELARHRALQAVRSAERAVDAARKDEARALQGYAVAHQAHRAVSRAQEKKRAEIQGELERKERRGLDEQAVLRFNGGKGPAER